MNRYSTSINNFLINLGRALVVSACLFSLAAAQERKTGDAAAPTSNNLKQMHLFGGISEPNPSLPDVFGLAAYRFEMRADVDGAGGGYALLSDPVFAEVNSHIRIESFRRLRSDVYLFRGTVGATRSSELAGKTVTIRVQILPDDNCEALVVIADSPLLPGLLLPAVQKIF